MIAWITLLRTELGKYMGLWSAVGVVSAVLLVLGIGMKDTPAMAVAGVLDRWGIPGAGVAAQVESWFAMHGHQMTAAMVVAMVLAIAGCVLAAVKDGGDERIHVLNRTKAPATLVVACMVSAQLGLPGAAVLTVFMAVVLISWALLAFYRREYAADAAVHLLMHFMLMLLYVPAMVIVGLFGWPQRVSRNENVA